MSRLLMLPGEGSLQLYEGQLLQWESNKNHREARRAGGWLCQDEAEYLLPVTGCQKLIEVDEEHKMSVFCERHVATEITAGALIKSEGVMRSQPVVE